MHKQDHFILAKTMVQLNQQPNIPVTVTSHCTPKTITSLFENHELNRLI
jgi:hypothetical protein